MSEPFHVGEIVLTQNLPAYFAPNLVDGQEVEVCALEGHHLAMLKGELGVFTGFVVSDLLGDQYGVCRNHLRKRQAPQDSRTITTWDECPFQPAKEPAV